MPSEFAGAGGDDSIDNEGEEGDISMMTEIMMVASGLVTPPQRIFGVRHGTLGFCADRACSLPLVVEPLSDALGVKAMPTRKSVPLVMR